MIDFGKNGNAKPDFVKKRIREIWDYWGSGITRGAFVDDYPIILLKNIDKITNPELRKELLLIFDPEKNTTYGKYQIKDWNGKPTGEEGNIDLSKFVLVVTTSTINPQLSKELQSKLKHIQPFLDKYFWLILCLSVGVEIIIFFLIRRSKKIS